MAAASISHHESSLAAMGVVRWVQKQQWGACLGQLLLAASSCGGLCCFSQVSSSRGGCCDITTPVLRHLDDSWQRPATQLSTPPHMVSTRW